MTTDRFESLISELTVESELCKEFDVEQRLIQRSDYISFHLTEKVNRLRWLMAIDTNRIQNELRFVAGTVFANATRVKKQAEAAVPATDYELAIQLIRSGQLAEIAALKVELEGLLSNVIHKHNTAESTTT